MSGGKRPAADSFGSSQLVKRAKSDANIGGSSAIAVVNGTAKNGALIQAVQRTSSLQSPTMELTGHTKEVFAARFDPTGQFIASGSGDRNILLWRSTGTCENHGILAGHKQAILDLRWSRDSKVLWSASADKTLASWDVQTGERLRRHFGHDEVINCMDSVKRGAEVLVSGSDDGCIGIWDARTKNGMSLIQTDFPVTAIAVSEDGTQVFSGSIDNDIQVWDVRNRKIMFSLLGHNDTITSLELSPDHNTLLSNSHDSTVRTWDIRPFAPVERSIRTYDGAPGGQDHNLLKASWDKKGERIAAGSGDQTIAIWNAQTGKLLHKLPGHRGAVNDVRFSPGDEPLCKFHCIPFTLTHGSSLELVWRRALGRMNIRLLTST
ncbi:WD40-repeat-containing domain protein [Massariosphaeria phaeospora]|uniref:WD40-repeat-containing domain protein n=1 Tax=Massariosphaeria phaeospora TaxID=100035 RepID=A0A7C8I1T3_9PLEO|nr:WD40-repeat-containing domain protein [Massariosphaeria phaeospora]